jgi:ABC-type nickel/cobalt efflux system permease component RcnA
MVHYHTHQPRSKMYMYTHACVQLTHLHTHTLSLSHTRTCAHSHKVTNMHNFQRSSATQTFQDSILICTGIISTPAVSTVLLLLLIRPTFPSNVTSLLCRITVMNCNQFHSNRYCPSALSSC